MIGTSEGTTGADGAAVQPRPLSARSVVLSLLLGAHPPQLPVRRLLTAAQRFGIAEATLRVALTRMVAAGDLVRSNATYRLSGRLLQRQRHQDAAIDIQDTPWHGQWETVVITATGRPWGDRSELRTELTRLRLAELREGVWMRPANLRRPLPTDLHRVGHTMTTTPDTDPATLCAILWDLDAWAGSARTLLHGFDNAATAAAQLEVAAAIVRLILTDPVLPAALQPPRWPAQQLRGCYLDYRETLSMQGDISP